MSKLTDQISYLQGLAEGMKLNPEKDSHRLILGILEVLGEVGEAYEALAESHGELSNYVESIDEDLADLEEEIFGDDEEDGFEEGDEDDDFDEEDDFDEADEDEDDDDDEEEDGEEEDDGDEIDLDGAPILYECPHCHTTVEIDPESVDFDEDALCPACGKELFPETLEE